MASEGDSNRTIQQLLAEVQSARSEVLKQDEERARTYDRLRKMCELDGGKTVGAAINDLDAVQKELAARLAKMGVALDQMSRKIGRPGSDGIFIDGVTNRDSAVGLLRVKHSLRVPKMDVEHPFEPNEGEIEQAQLAVKGVRQLLQTTNIETLAPDVRKALSSFTLGSSGFILPPEMSEKVLSCLTEPTDVSGIVGTTSISGPSIKWLVDNVSLGDTATWACDTDCWGQTQIKSLVDGLGELEIKPDSLRYVVCTSRDLLEDSSVDIENWMTGKVSRAVRATVSQAVMTGDGIGKPMGILSPQAGIPICEVSANTPSAVFTWQDVYSLKYQVPMPFHAGARYLMNQTTFGQMLTMSDANGRPIMIASPVQDGEFFVAGSPVSIVTQMPDCVSGATPVAFGNWGLAYQLVTRKAVTLQVDPYTAGFCCLHKWEARVGGNVVCQNAARLLRIR